MIEVTVREQLQVLLEGTEVHMQVPSPMPEADFVVLEKTGSDRSEHLNHSMIAVQSYGVSLYRAAALNDLVKEAMFRLPEKDNGVTACYLNSDYNYTDTASKRYRYQAVFDVYHY